MKTTSSAALVLLTLLCILPTGAEPYTWKNVAIVGGGFVTGIVTHPTEKNVIYARTDVGGAYRWDASTNRWTPITDWIDGDHWSDTGIESIAIDPSNPDRVYLAVGTYVTNWSPTNGAILRSDDRGKTWNRTDLPFKNGGNEIGRSMGERLIVDPRDGNRLFFGTRTSGLWKSEDAGKTWSQQETFPAIATSESAGTAGQWKRPLGIAFVWFDLSQNAIYAGVGTQQTSLYRSTEAGAKWVPVPNQPTGLRPNHIAQGRDGMIYVSYGDDPGPNTMTNGALWKLDPTSDTWTDITPEKPTADRKFGYGAVTVGAQHPQTIMTASFCRWNGDDHIYRSIDGGKTWRTMREHAILDWSAAPWLTWGKKTLRMGHWIGDIEIDPTDSNHVLYATGWGVWDSRDVTNVDRDADTHWVFTRGIEECVVNNVISPPSGAHVLSVMWDIDGFRHEDLDVSPPKGFFLPQVGRNTDIDFAEKDPDIMVRVFDGNNTHGAYSSDNGQSWTVFPAAPEGKGAGDIAVSADGATFVSTPQDGQPQVTHDRGKTWNECAGIPAKIRVVSDRVDPKMFFGFDADTGTVFVSTDAADSFTARASDLPKAAGYLRAMPGHAGNVALASDRGLFGSRDGGATFTQVPQVQSAKRIGYGKAAPGEDYCATYLIGTIGGTYGFYRSDDLGANWTRINDDQHQYGGVSCITGDPRVYGRCYVGSSNRGVIYGDPRR
jgi:photosystem II stability/assembly factor-like uncharacterized protein